MGPIRMFFQLSALRFFPIVNTEKYKTWKDLDGVDMYTHARGSGTESIMNLMAKKNGIKYKSMSYVPGSAVRAGAMLQGRIFATIVDSERRRLLLRKGKGKFALLPLPEINASDEALYANIDFLKSQSSAIDILLEELIKVWREVNKNPEAIVGMRKQYNLLPDMPKKDVDDIVPYYKETVSTGAFSDNGGGVPAVKGDFEFYGFAGHHQGRPLQAEGRGLLVLGSLEQGPRQTGPHVSGRPGPAACSAGPDLFGPAPPGAPFPAAGGWFP